jgi:hypothetical protein
MDESLLQIANIVSGSEIPFLSIDIFASVTRSQANCAAWVLVILGEINSVIKKGVKKAVISRLD